MGRRVDVLEALPVIEDIRHHEGETGHELSFPFLVRWRDGYEPGNFDPIAIVERDGSRSEARWMPLLHVFGGAETIHPAGFTAMLIDRLSRALPEEPAPRRPPSVRIPTEDGAPPPGRQRAVALGHLLWRDHLLVQPAVPGDPPAWRSLGGGIELGERAEDAVRRELLEETGRAVDIVAAKGVAENIFERDGAIGHEVVFEYLLRWADGHEPDDLADSACTEADGSRFAARWMPLDEALNGEHVVYPDGFVGRLRGWLEDGTA